MPLVFISSPFRRYDNAVVVTKIKEATCTDCKKLVEIVDIAPFGVIRQDFLDNNNLYSSETPKSCYELINTYTNFMIELFRKFFRQKIFLTSIIIRS